MTQENKPLQLWAYTGDDGMACLTSFPISFSDGAVVHHMIEFSAYEAEREKVRRLRDVLAEVENYIHWRADDLVGDDLIGDQKHTAKFNYLTRKIANTWKEIEDL